MVEACHLLAEWNDEDLALVRQQAATARIQKESPTHTQWWEHVHVDGPGDDVGRTHGVIGMRHVDIAGRLQIFVRPA